MKRLPSLTIALLVLLACIVTSCHKKELQPKLVVGVVIDQMRFDYLYRYYAQYSDNGFKRLLKNGMNFTYAQYNYVPTYTGPGHASIYTGTVPFYHGITSNEWYDRKKRKLIYCVKDEKYQTVGSDNISGQSSPENLLASTLGDELRMSNNGQSRVFAASIKDRAAVLPGGHMANAAYWYDPQSGKFISSSYYMKELPEWVKLFNAQKIVQKLMSGEWNLSLPVSDYLIAMPDSGAGETDVFKEGKTSFSHSFSKIPEIEKPEYLINTPYGNELVADFAINLLRNEKLGQGKYTDFLALSFSSTDYVGHAFGPNSMEIMDTYIKLDQQLALLMEALDKSVGKGNYLLFLTADHGVKPNSAYLENNRVPSGFMNSATVEDSLEAYTKRLTGIKGIIDTLEGNQIYINHQLIDHKNIDAHSLNSRIVAYLRAIFTEMVNIYSADDCEGKIPVRSMTNFVQNGFNAGRSGDLSFELRANFLTENGNIGTTHGTSYDYDTHVPLIFYGWHIEPGESSREVYIEDIAPTVANLIHIQEPNATIGIPILSFNHR